MFIELPIIWCADISHRLYLFMKLIAVLEKLVIFGVSLGMIVSFLKKLKATWGAYGF